LAISTLQERIAGDNLCQFRGAANHDGDRQPRLRVHRGLEGLGEFCRVQARGENDVAALDIGLDVTQSDLLAGVAQPVHLERVAADVDAPQHGHIDGQTGLP
jgi:hypothetical protein